MEYLKKLLEKKNMPQFLLSIFFIIYLVIGFRMPENIADKIDTQLGKILIALGALILFACSNPILGVLGIIVAYELIKRSSVSTGRAALAKYYPTEENKWSPFNHILQFTYSLEQDMVKKMSPMRNPNAVPIKTTFKPGLDNLYDAAPINYQGVI